MQHSSYSAAIRQIFDRINQRESGSQLRLHFVLPIANLGKKREGRRRRRMMREKRVKRGRVVQRQVGERRDHKADTERITDMK